MAAAPRKVSPGGSEPFGGTVTGHFRPLGPAPSAPAPAMPDSAPPFGSAMLGYERHEVDAWCRWVAAWIAHARRETVRADSAEASLAAALDRIAELGREQPGRREPEAPVGAAGQGAGARQPRSELPRRTVRGSQGVGPGAAAPRETSRMDVLQAGIHEVATLLHRLVDLEAEQAAAAKPAGVADDPPTV